MCQLALVHVLASLAVAIPNLDLYKWTIIRPNSLNAQSNVAYYFSNPLFILRELVLIYIIHIYIYKHHQDEA